MKKLLALFLAILMIASVALVSCQAKKATTGGNNGDNNDVENTDDDNNLVIPDDFNIGYSESGSDSSSDTTGSANGNNNNTSVNGFQTVTSFSVYTYTKTNIRQSANMDSNSLKTVDPSAELTVVAKKDTVGNAWYKVKYGETEGYVLQDVVSTNKDDTVFTDLATTSQKKITVKEGGEPAYAVNIRQYPIFGDNVTQKIVTLTNAQTNAGQLVKIGENKTGSWYKVSYTYTPEGKNEAVTETYYLAITSKTIPHILVDGQPIGNQNGGGI